MTNPAYLQAVADQLHPSRLQTYAQASSTSLADQLALYRWNLTLSAAFQEVLSVTEVALRNAIDANLRRWNATQQRSDGSSYPEEWLLAPARPLASYTAQMRGTAKKYAEDARAARPATHSRKNALISHDDMLAQLSFGALVKLLPNAGPAAPSATQTPPSHVAASPSTSNVPSTADVTKAIIWQLARPGDFPYRTGDATGAVLVDRVSRLHSLRNRVAHMEPLLDVNVKARHTDVMRVLGAVSPELQNWCSGISRVKPVLQTRP